MKILPALLLLAVATPTPTLAQDLRTNTINFCYSVRKINAQGIPARPGTMGGSLLADTAGITEQEYAAAWQYARWSRLPNCGSIQ
jgi:hypothetical protein